MTTGIQVFDASGKVLFDTNYNAGRILGMVGPVTGNGSLNHAGFASGRPFAVATQSSANSAIAENTPTIKITDTTMTWQFSQGISIGTPPPTYIFYGVY